jgi:pyruvate formate lyase activating enzyme
MHKARLWKPARDGKVACHLCSHACVIADGELGKCGVRVNSGGELHTKVYDRIAALNLDPIEKKPLYHYKPGTTSFSIGTAGCNMACTFCQNAGLSQSPKAGGMVQGQLAKPEEIVDAAVRSGAASISYTYSEPTIFFELVQDTSKLALEKGLANVMVSNGFMTGKCLEELDGLIQAANIDLKAFTDTFYEEQCDARLKPVLSNLKQVKEMGWWLEVTTLVIPGLNDSASELAEIAGFIAGELGRDTPWHISRFQPTHRLTDRGPTPVSALETAHDKGREAGLHYIYVGNVPGHARNSTYCPECEACCIERSGFAVHGRNMQGRACAACGTQIAGLEPSDL